MKGRIRTTVTGVRGPAWRVPVLLVLLWCGSPWMSSVLSAGPAGDTGAIYEHFRKGDLGALYESIEKLLFEYPQSPEAFLYLSDLVRLADAAGHDRVKQSLLKLRAQSALFPENLRNLYGMKIAMELEKLAALKEPGEVRRIADGLAPVREWSISGPYHRYGAYDINYPWIPEAARDMRSIDRKFIRLEKPDAVLDFNEYLYPEKGSAYAITTLDRRGTIRLRFQSGASYAVFINGRAALRNVEGEVNRSLRVLEVSGSGAVTVMVKVHRGSAWGFRMLVSDENDLPVICDADTEKMVFNSCSFAEVMEYPFKELPETGKADSAQAHFVIGNYFDELGSEEAVRHYKAAAAQDPKGIHRYFLATCMLEHSRGARDSAYALEAVRILDALADEFPDFIPVGHRKFQRLIEQRSLLEACTFGAGLAGKAPAYLPLRAEYSELLRTLEHEKEFEEHAKLFLADFPHSDLPVLELAEYHLKRDPVRSAELCRQVLARSEHQRAFDLLLGLLRNQGKSEDALSLLDRFNHDGAMNDTVISVLIDAGAYGKARKLLYKNTISRKKPADFVRLGLLSYLEGGDPAMDWEKALGMNPADFSTADLMDYIYKGRIEKPLSGYRDERAEDHIIEWAMSAHGDYSSEVIYRDLVYSLNEDGSSRAFCEEVLYVHDLRGVEKWGEYRVPLRGTMHPLRARVYDDEGRYTDSYRIEEVNGANYINLASLKERSTVHIAYGVDNPFLMRGESGFISIPYTLLQEFEEPLHVLSLKIIAPARMRIVFDHSADISPSTEIRGDKAIYTIKLTGLPYIKREEYSGVAVNHLPYFAASTMTDISDFTQWYSGLIINKPGPEGEILSARFRGDSDERTAMNVFTHVENDIDLSGEVLYYPDSPRDVEYKKRGTVEDKVLLAKNILQACGITSFTAFGRRKELPDTGRFVSPDVYSDILLYVPGIRGEGCWLDFSRRYSAFGVVNSSLQGTKALVLGENGYERREVRSDKPDSIEREFRFVLDESGDAECRVTETMNGQHGTLREYFANSLFEERAVNQVFNALVPSMAIDSYVIENLKSVDSPLVISASGKCFSVTPPLTERILIGIPSKSGVTRYIQSTERALPLYIQDSINERERCVFVLPGRFIGSEYAHTEELSCRFGRAKIRVEKKKGIAEVLIEKEISVPAARIGRDHYREFLDFCMKLDEAEKRNVIIVK